MAKEHSNLKGFERRFDGLEGVVGELRRVADLLEQHGIDPGLREYLEPPRIHKELDHTWVLEMDLWAEIDADKVENPAGDEGP